MTTATTQAPRLELFIRDCRAAFTQNLWVPQKKVDANTGKTTYTHSMALIIPPDHPQIEDIKAAQRAAAAQKWPNNPQAPNYTQQMLQALQAQDKLALHDGNIKMQYVGYPGNFYLNGNNSTRPRIVDVYGKTVLRQEDCRIYSGCYVLAHVEIWAQDNQHGKRVNVSLKGVQFLRDGDAFGGGGISREDAFSNQAGDDNPFAGQDQTAQGGTSLI